MKVYLRCKEIKKILMRKNKSQNWLAHKLEVSTGYMSQLVDGARCPSPKLRERIMNNLTELKFDDLFEIKDTD
ncbi:MAG: helix-turn-helix transcriptional regulator [Deltaproteobacteria bacterium]|nr:helix-turn-helix transcriptional regulator [Deltaproteobacteria bacterium]